MPVASSVDRILDDLDIGKGELLEAMENSIYKLFRVQVARSDWKLELPPYLQPRFHVYDNEGKGGVLKKAIEGEHEGKVRLPFEKDIPLATGTYIKFNVYNNSQPFRFPWKWEGRNYILRSG